MGLLLAVDAWIFLGEWEEIGPLELIGPLPPVVDDAAEVDIGDVGDVGGVVQPPERCRISWTSLLYSPHFVTTLEQKFDITRHYTIFY